MTVHMQTISWTQYYRVHEVASIYVHGGRGLVSFGVRNQQCLAQTQNSFNIYIGVFFGKAFLARQHSSSLACATCKPLSRVVKL